MPDINYIGNDIALNEYGDFMILPSGDISYISDIDNISQALQNRAVSEKGELLYNLDYGFDYTIIFGKNTEEKINLIKSLFIQEISKDPRVKSIKSIDVFTNRQMPTLRPDQIYIQIGIVPINRNDVVVLSIVFPQVSFDAITNNITGENQRSVNKSTVNTNYTIKSVIGVYLLSDINKTGTNYYTGGSFTTNTITLGTFLAVDYVDVVIDYSTIDIPVKNLYIKNIENEIVSTTNTSILSVSNDIYDVAGVYLFSDQKKQNNYWFNIIGDNYNKGQISIKEIILPKNLPYGSVVFSTTLTSDLSAGNISFNVADVSGIRRNQYILIDKQGTNEEFLKVKDISGNEITLYSTSVNSHLSGEIVEINTNNLIVDYTTYSQK